MLIRIYFLALLLLPAISHPSSNTNNQLNLISSYPIDSIIDIEPSGLSRCGRNLLFVSDNIDKKIFRLRKTHNTVTAEVFITIPELPEKDISMYPPDRQALIIYAQQNLENYIDWEGITCRGRKIFLASESYADILEIDKITLEARWLETPLFSIGYQQGWFNQHNAYIEGITTDRHSCPSFIVSMEREPRGLAKIRLSNDGWLVETYNPMISPIPPTGNRPDDFSGVSRLRNRLITLERNASSICSRSLKDLAVKQCWSYEHIENNPNYSYSNKEFGIAEGLFVSHNYIYLIVDNNHDFRDSNPDDTRPQLFIFKFPER